ncbi:hypothetical protein HPB50_029644 [Hyalomma asiaticum]|nr:hypothetical protein HPB50_029644 [Hyalomma asiaticum]
MPGRVSRCLVVEQDLFLVRILFLFLILEDDIVGPRLDLDCDLYLKSGLDLGRWWTSARKCPEPVSRDAYGRRGYVVRLSPDRYVFLELSLATSATRFRFMKKRRISAEPYGKDLFLVRILFLFLILEDDIVGPRLDLDCDLYLKSGLDLGRW